MLLNNTKYLTIRDGHLKRSRIRLKLFCLEWRLRRANIVYEKTWKDIVNNVLILTELLFDKAVYPSQPPTKSYQNASKEPMG